MIRKILEGFARRILAEKKTAVDHIAALNCVEKLEAAIKVVAEALPEPAAHPHFMNNITAREDLLRRLIDGGSVIASCDWECHPTHIVCAKEQPNGRLLLSIKSYDQLRQEGQL